jgi:hypothetical protein
VFTEPLPSNGRLFWLHCYSRFQVFFCGGGHTHKQQGDLISPLLFIFK